MKSLITKIIVLTFFITSAISLPSFGQLANSPDIVRPILPKAFVLAEFEEISEKYAPDYQHLLDVCDGDIDAAFTKWLDMLAEMETASQKEQLDLGGVKMWMQVYFSKDGSIDHIGFFLKPNSKNIDQSELSVFLEKFARQYKFPIDAAEKFSHYTAVSFPVFAGS